MGQGPNTGAFYQHSRRPHDKGLEANWAPSCAAGAKHPFPAEAITLPDQDGQFSLQTKTLHFEICS